MNAPVIGVVGHGHIVPRFWGELPVVGASTRYVDSVVAAGGRPVVLPGGSAAGLLDLVDGVVLTGGGDVDPRTYGGDPAVARDVDPARDRAEIELVHLAMRARIPLLGVCRGMQVLVVALGGHLTGDLGMRHVMPEAGHPVTTTPGSLVAALLGGQPMVTSLHHQAVADPGPHWVPTALAEDGVIEAVEPRPCDWPVLGVQWHPELDDPTGPALFGWLVAEAAVAGSAERPSGRHTFSSL